MEILQTIWTALTTENEVVTKATSIPMTILEIIVTTLLFTKVFKLIFLDKNIKYKVKIRIYKSKDVSILYNGT